MIDMNELEKIVLREIDSRLAPDESVPFGLVVSIAEVIQKRGYVRIGSKSLREKIKADKCICSECICKHPRHTPIMAHTFEDGRR